MFRRKNPIENSAPTAAFHLRHHATVMYFSPRAAYSGWRGSLVQVTVSLEGLISDRAPIVPGQRLIDRAKRWARSIKVDVVALWIAARDPRTPWYAKAVAAAVAAYALSPIDLIPDFIPVLGYLDDLLIVPLGIMLAVRLIPLPLMVEFRAAAARRTGRPRSFAGAAAIAAIWLLALALVAWLVWPR